MTIGDIVALSTVPWSYWSRHQQLLTRLARGSKLLYVEAGGNWFIRSSKGKVGLRQAEGWPNVWIYTAPSLPPLKSSIRSLNFVAQRLIVGGVKRCMAELGIENPLLWLNRPTFSPHVGCFAERAVIYDCADDFVELGGVVRPDVLHKMEGELLERATLSLVSSEKLFQDRTGRCSALLLIRNGADVHHFAQGGSPVELPAVLRERTVPVIGFYGGLSHWIDYDLLYGLAGRRPDWSFVLIGPSLVDMDRLASLRNVHWLGEIAYEDLPSHARRFDVCLIPFVRNRLTDAVDPIKAYEYLAMGKPIVSTPLPELKRFGALVYTTEGLEGFENAIDKALSENGSHSKDRQAVAFENSWESRVEEIRNRLSSLIAERNAGRQES